jgi:hypothetical protein
MVLAMERTELVDLLGFDEILGRWTVEGSAILHG